MRLADFAAHAAGAPGPGDAALAALVYADLFDYPLTEEEVTSYQVGTAFSRETIAEALSSLLNGGLIACSGGRFCLAGREGLFETRMGREGVAARLWRRAETRARWVARTPFVRMAAVTGALSVNNVAGKPDIDLLVVCEPGRVWICRRFLILQVRLARLLGDDLCPNYILASSHLELDQRDFFTAHELAQMVPLHGHALHSEMLGRNLWAARYLPSAFSSVSSKPARTPAFGAAPLPTRLLERALRARFFDLWEGWELDRLRRKLAPLIGAAAEVVCAPEQCKGHTGLHRSSVLARFRERLRQVGRYDLFAPLLDDEGSGPLMKVVEQMLP